VLSEGVFTVTNVSTNHTVVMPMTRLSTTLLLAMMMLQQVRGQGKSKLLIVNQYLDQSAIYASVTRFRFPICCYISRALRVTGVENRGQVSHFLIP